MVYSTHACFVFALYLARFKPGDRRELVKPASSCCGDWACAPALMFLTHFQGQTQPAFDSSLGSWAPPGSTFGCCWVCEENVGPWSFLFVA